MKRPSASHSAPGTAGRLIALLIAWLLCLPLLLSCGDSSTAVPVTANPTPIVTTVSGTVTSAELTDAVISTVSISTTKRTPVSEPLTEPITDPDTPVIDSSGLTAEDLSPTTDPLTSVTEPITEPTTDPLQITTEPSDPPLTAPETEAHSAEQYAQLSRNAAYVLLYDMTDGKLLYSTGDGQQIYPASTTKLLTLHYALTLVDESTVFTVGSEIDLAPSDSSKAKIRKGEQYTCKDMIAALLLPSGNDAAYTLAAHCGRLLAEDQTLSAKEAVARFMEGLNAYAASLGLDGTHFVTPDGYHDDAHVTTMADILQIALLARSHPLLAEIMAMDRYQVTDLANGRTQTWENSNLLLLQSSNYYYPYATGAKTGFHTPAGACLIATAEKDGRELMVLIFKCSNKNARFVDAQNFLELGFTLQGAA
ncbi:MAG: D-alanyl-D-alanine carboxypeptidase [Clostridia bacterium]|nr:D-alanyl-D-alanine carboxypeptidase [Clostridia bacterium]